MRRATRLGGLLALAATTALPAGSAAASSGGAALQAPMHMQGRSAPPYLPPQSVPDTIAILPRPPAPGSAAENADRALFEATRSLAGSPRFALATRDARLDSPSLADDFACALGARPTPAATPAFFRILDRAKEDTRLASGRPKDLYKRARPFIGNDLPICVPRDPRLAANGSYPSGHAAIGEAIALILAEAAPADRTTAILARGRVFGESRLVCGVHWASDVESGFVVAASLVAALHASPDFDRDVAQLREELARLPRTAPPADACRIEADAATHPILFTPAPGAGR